MRNVLYLSDNPPQNPQLQSNHEETQIKEESIRYLNSLFKIVKVTQKIKTEKLTLELQLNAMWSPGLDPGIQRNTSEKTDKI